MGAMWLWEREHPNEPHTWKGEDLTHLGVTGDQGWSRAATALIFGGLTLLPAAYFGWLAVSMPPSPVVRFLVA